MKQPTREIWILAAKRTPFGAMSGALKGVTATELGVVAAKAAIAQSGAKPQEIDHVFAGNVQQTSADASFLARHVGLKAGLPIETPALTVNRLCGSGFQAIVSAAEQIVLGDARLALAVGTENMTQAPHVMRGLRDGARYGQPPVVEDSLHEGLTDRLINCAMGVTAENLAEKYGITREMADTFALRSQKRWAAAQDGGRFSEELTPVTLESKKGPTVFERDEHPRPNSDMATLGKLKPVFKKDGVVTAANASGICDGAGALVLADAEYARAQGYEPLARIRSWAVVGVPPEIMGIGPAPSIRKALERAGLKQSDIELFDVNEAFAAQVLAVQKELGLDDDTLNVNGGGIALGHPLGASGARITANLVYELRARGKSLAIGSACIGGGQGIAIVLERT